VGTPRKFDWTPRDHLEIGRDLDMIDFEAGGKVTGSGFYYLKNDAVLLDLALQQYTMKKLAGAGFTPVITPDLARIQILEGIGFNPRGSETQVYSVDQTDLCLVGTAEITLGGMLADTVLDESEMPKKYVGLSHCFRTEAGAAGRDTRGMLRQHQFDKVELVRIETPETSWAGLEELTRHAEIILEKLELPYRRVALCTGDMGLSAAKTYDLEVWLPAQNTYREISSCSHFDAFQARRMQARFRNEKGKPELAQTLNGSGLAVGRTLVAVLENYQRKDGSVDVPVALRPYMGDIELIEKA